MGNRLFRNTQDKMLGGVCSGIADYVDIDPTIVRLCFVALSFLGGAAVIAYLVGWILIPEKSV